MAVPIRLKQIAMPSAVLVCLTFSLSGPCYSQSEQQQLPVDFIRFTERGEWQTWSDGRLRIRIPRSWKVAIDVPSRLNRLGSKSVGDDGVVGSWKYRIIHANGEQVVLTIDVKQGGPEFIPCYCTARRNYGHSVVDGVKIWSVGLGDGELRGFKAASKTMRLDIHKALPEDNPAFIRYILESARPVEPESK